MKNILAIGAHPDDIEVGCFGTLYKLKSENLSVHIVITTKGGYGKRNWKTINQEMGNALKILNPNSVSVLDNKIGHIQINWKTVSEIDDLIDKHDIDTIFTPWYGDSHQDHQQTFKIVMAACRKSRVDNIYCCEQGNYVFHAHFGFRPQWFVDIGDTINYKIEAMNCYKSYYDKSDLENIKSLAQYRGSCCKAKYAEAFEIIRQVKR